MHLKPLLVGRLQQDNLPLGNAANPHLNRTNKYEREEWRRAEEKEIGSGEGRGDKLLRHFLITQYPSGIQSSVRHTFK